ncbi:acyltransferase family protein [Pseudobutyrivibrio sp. MD2005]|uniref:acyltransferase family protein n=1 Tax=Pseudobutyrivibrio sp. MD2005 TaxID=1410616 RepID=UPI0004853A99|nr:acyltransferase [Pseudobutyrivibrio sp. MD2005]
MNTKERDHAIDVLKILATAIIIMHHYTQDIYATGTGFFFGGPVNFGRCVELFFIISGYLMYRYQITVQRHEISFKKFYCIRAFRLLPLVGIAAIVYEIGLILFKSATGTLFLNEDLNLSGALFDSLGIQDGWATLNPMVNNPTWYISVLMLCYLIFYVINYLAGKHNISANYYYLAMIFIGIGVLSYEINLPFLNSSSGRGYYAFFTGILLANFISANKESINKYSLLAVILIMLTLGYILYVRMDGQNFDDYYWLTFAFFSALIILAETKVAKKIFSSSFWSVIAKCAYDVFIWHVCMEMLYKYLLIRYPALSLHTEWKMMLGALVIDWIVGLFSYYFIEKPISAKTRVLIERIK